MIATDTPITNTATASHVSTTARLGRATLVRPAWDPDDRVGPEEMRLLGRSLLLVEAT